MNPEGQSSRPREPVLVGIGLVQQREEDPLRAKEPLALMIAAARAAAADSGAPALLSKLDRILVPRGRWRYTDPGHAIGKAIGAPAAGSVLATVGVLQQSLIADACQRIAAGESRAALVVGGDAGYRLLRARIAGVELTNTAAEGTPGEVWAPAEELRHPAERAAGLEMAVGLYALIDSALRKSAGRDPAAHRARLGELYAGFSRVAASNPHAWTRRTFEPEEIVLPGPGNAMQAFPYTRRLCSSWNVDQASALLLTSTELADAFGIAPNLRIHPLASAESNAMTPVSARPRLDGSPGARLVGEACLDAAGLTIPDVGLFELYSCFPAAIEIFARDLAIPPDRPLTVTGGMSFAGGPYNNYQIHATGQMALALRAGRARVGAVSCISGIVTKQALGLWSQEPALDGFVSADVSQAARAEGQPRPVLAEAEGEGVVLGCTVLGDVGADRRAVSVVELAGGARVVAVSTDPATVSLVEGTECGGCGAIVDGSLFRLLSG